MPFVVDWDLGRSDAIKNPELEDYWFVGISDRANPLFDLYGLVKTFLYHREWFEKGEGNAIATSPEATRLEETFEIFERRERDTVGYWSTSTGTSTKSPRS